MFNVKLAEETLKLHEELAEMSHLEPEEFRKLLEKYEKLDFASQRVVAAMCGATESMWREQAQRDAADAYRYGYQEGQWRYRVGGKVVKKFKYSRVGVWIRVRKSRVATWRRMRKYRVSRWRKLLRKLARKS